MNRLEITVACCSFPQRSVKFLFCGYLLGRAAITFSLENSLENPAKAFPPLDCFFLKSVVLTTSKTEAEIEKD